MELFEFQKEAKQKILDLENLSEFNLFFEMGLGKTFTTLETIKEIAHTTVLIVCPKILIPMWEYQFSKHMHGYALVRYPTQVNDKTKKVYHVMNYEQFLNATDILTPDICILDEVHKLKNPNSKTHKKCKALLHPRIVFRLTGTPITKDLDDLFGILTCTNGKHTVFDLTKTRWHSKYVQNVGDTTMKDLWKKLDPITVFADLDDHIELPEYIDIIIKVDLTDEQRKDHDWFCTTSDKALVRIMNSQRFTSSIKTDVVKALVNNIVSEGEKVVIFTKFREEYDRYMQLPKSVGINGSVKDRETPVREFQTNPEIMIFNGNLQTAGLGITLTAAAHCIHVSNTYNLADYIQARARVRRIGQQRGVTYYHIICPGTIDEMILESLENKTDLIETFKSKYGGD